MILAEIWPHGPKLTPERAQLLRDQTFSDTQPGDIVHDFQVLLDFIGEGDGVVAGGKHHWLPMKCLVELNDRMNWPLQLKIQRPQQRSYPNLSGLYLLLRATGLAQVGGSGKSARLTLDPAALASWRSLEPTERYFSLLEAYLRYGNPEVLGGRGGWHQAPLLACVQLWQLIGALRAESPYGNDHHLALMKLFGLIDIKQKRTLVGKPWSPGKINYLPFGEAMFGLLGQVPVLDSLDDPVEDSRRLGIWQPIFAPYVPAWRKSLDVSAPEFREGLFVFKASLGRSWRRIAAPANRYLDNLALAILEAFTFDYDHMYCFRYTGPFGDEVRLEGPGQGEGRCSEDVAIGQLTLPVGDTMVFHFDFGDNWLFDVKLERIDPPDETLQGPVLLGEQGEAPQQYPDWDE